MSDLFDEPFVIEEGEGAKATTTRFVGELRGKVHALGATQASDVPCKISLRFQSSDEALAVFRLLKAAVQACDPARTWGEDA